MMFFNIPDIFHLGDTFRQGYESRYERKVGRDFRNSVLLAPLEESLGNLLDIRSRIQVRVDKEIASGTDMTIASTSLDNADTALIYAANAVAVATSTVTGTNPHPAYRESQAAYIALNQARESLNIALDTITTAIDTASSTPHKTIHAKNRE